MKILAVLLLVLLLPFLAVGGEFDLREFAREAGLPDTVELLLVTSEGEIQGGYWPGGYLCQYFMCEFVPETIFVAMPEGAPWEWTLAVLYHEMGHWEQNAEGLPRWAWDEWDADRRAIIRLCGDGLNGPAIMAEVLTALLAQAGSVVDSASHGNLYLRVENSRARGCDGELREPQALQA